MFSVWEVVEVSKFCGFLKSVTKKKYPFMHIVLKKMSKSDGQKDRKKRIKVTMNKELHERKLFKFPFWDVSEISGLKLNFWD